MKEGYGKDFMDVKTEVFTVSYHKSKSLAKVIFTSKVLLSLELLTEVQRQLDGLTLNDSYCLLTNMGNKITPTKEAYDFYADKNRAKYITKEAFVVSAAALKIAANFYLRVKRPIIITKVFETELEAENWLINTTAF
jgi:hypothetical protein